MDENYLDELLKNAEAKDSNIDERELHSISELVTEDVKPEEPTMEQTLAEDAGHVKDVAWSDAEIPADEISELDELDELADLDMDHMDFDDIDFDDVDVTKMNLDPVRVQKELDDFDSMNIDEHYLDETADDPEFEEELRKMTAGEDAEPDEKDAVLDSEADTESEEEAEADVDAWMKEIFGDSEGSSADMKSMENAETEDNRKEESQKEQKQGKQQVSIDDLDDITEVTDDEMLNASNAVDPTAMMEDTDTTKAGGTDDMEDLFAMLGIESTGMDTSMPEKDEIPDFEIPEEVEEPDAKNQKNKKKTFMDTLFGDDEEDTLTPEQEAKLAEEKEQKKQEKLAKKAEKKKQQAEANSRRKAEKEKKTAQLVAKKAARKEADEKALAADGPEKKLNGPLSVITILFFLLIGGAVIGGTYVFGYVHTVTKASNYFERQKYGMAYREILGEKLRASDQPLQDKIYTVMYIERQYESYENYVAMNEPEQALDALLYGLSKYDTYYNDAVELGIVDDYNTARTHIVTALKDVFGLTESDAAELNTLSGTEYTDKIKHLTENMDFSQETP